MSSVELAMSNAELLIRIWLTAVITFVVAEFVVPAVVRWTSRRMDRQK